MTLFLWMLGWYLTGWITCVLMMYLDYRDGHDITLGDIGFAMVLSIFGPVIILDMIYVAFRKYGDRVIIKRRR